MRVAWERSAVCASRRACRDCRDRVGGRGFRESISAGYELPSGGVDFDCPHGVPWNATPDPLPADFAARRLERCDACDNVRKAGPIWSCGLPVLGALSPGACGCVVTIKARLPGARCPSGKWPV